MRLKTRLHSIWIGNRAILLLLLAVLIVRMLWILYTGYVNEDAFITFRFARNLAQGQGFTYNPGERVYGTTTPLFTLLLTGWLLLWHDPIPGAWFLNLLAACGTFYFTARALEQTSTSLSQRFFALFFLILSPKLWVLDTSGMETPLLLFFMAASWYAFKIGRWRWTGFLLGMMLWVRVDSGLWLIVLGLAAFVEDRRAGILVGLIAAGTYLPWILFAWLYFGTPIPLTITAKYWAYNVKGSAYPINFIEPPLSMMLARLQPLTDVLYGSTPIDLRLPFVSDTAKLAFVSVLLAGWGALRAVRKRQLAWLALFSVLEIARLAIFKITFFERYFAAVIWSVCILLGYLLGTFWDYLKAVHAMRIVRTAIPAALVLQIVCLTPGAASRFRDVQVHRHEASLKAIGTWLRANTLSNTTVQLEPLGYIGYYAERVMIDEVGLVTPEVIELKKQGLTQPPDMIVALSPDAFVIHCDDARRLIDDPTWQDHPHSERYHFEVRFDSLRFMDDLQRPADEKALARASCYEIWIDSEAVR